MAVDWSFSRREIHCATGKRCLADQARISARVSGLHSRAETMAFLNWWSKWDALVDSIVYHLVGCQFRLLDRYLGAEP